MIPVLAKYPEGRLRLLEHARTRLVALNEIITFNDRQTDKQLALKNDDLDDEELGTGRFPGCAIGFGPTVNSDDANLFASNPLFQDAPVAFVQALSGRMVTKKFKEGEVVMREDEKFRAETEFVYWIAKGEVEIWKAGNVVTVLKEGDTFGELAALRKLATRQATVKCKTPLTCRAVIAKTLLEILAEHDEDLFEMWSDVATNRAEELRKKVALEKQLKMRTTDIDFMFLKLPGLQRDQKVTPRNQIMSEALEGMEVYEWNHTGMHPIKKKTRDLPPLSAR